MNKLLIILVLLSTVFFSCNEGAKDSESDSVLNPVNDSPEVFKQKIIKYGGFTEGPDNSTVKGQNHLGKTVTIKRIEIWARSGAVGTGGTELIAGINIDETYGHNSGSSWYQLISCNWATDSGISIPMSVYIFDSEKQPIWR